MQYSYPLDESWSTQETIIVVEFLALVEQANQTGVSAQQLLMAYQKFKQVVRSKSEEKTIDKNFQKNTGFSVYRTIKYAQDNKDKKRIKMM